MKSTLCFSLVALGLLVGACARTDPKFLGSGTIEAREVTVSAKAQGQLLRFDAEEGRELKKGEALGQIEAERLSAQRDDLAAKLEGLGVAEKKAIARKKQLRTSYDSLVENLGRLETLYREQTIPRKNLDDLKAETKGTRIELDSIDLSFADIDAQRKQLAASQKLLAIALRESHVQSPLRGTVTKKYAEEGEFVTPGAPLCRIADLDDLWVKVYLDERTLSKLRLHGKVSVLSGGKRSAGQVTWISPKAEFTPKQVQTSEVNATLVYATKVVLSHPDRSLRIGMPVEVSLP